MFNRYSYVYNNPVNYTDPAGNFAWWSVGLIVVAFIAVSVIDAAMNGASGHERIGAAIMGANLAFGFFVPVFGITRGAVPALSYSLSAKDPSMALEFLATTSVFMAVGTGNRDAGRIVGGRYGIGKSIENEQYFSAGLSFALLVAKPTGREEIVDEDQEDEGRLLENDAEQTQYGPMTVRDLWEEPKVQEGMRKA